jgi:hypothetical protein
MVGSVSVIVATLFGDCPWQATATSIATTPSINLMGGMIQFLQRRHRRIVRSRDGILFAPAGFNHGGYCLSKSFATTTVVLFS